MDILLDSMPILTDFLDHKDKVAMKTIFTNAHYLNYSIQREKHAFKKIEKLMPYWKDQGCEELGFNEEVEWIPNKVARMYIREYMPAGYYKGFAKFCAEKIPNHSHNFIDNQMPEIQELANKPEITRREFYNLIKKLAHYQDILEFVGF